MDKCDGGNRLNSCSVWRIVRLRIWRLRRDDGGIHGRLFLRTSKRNAVLQ